MLCMIELGELEARHADFSRRNARVMVVSLDNQEDAAKTQAQFPDLRVVADSEAHLVSAAGVLQPHAVLRPRMINAYDEGDEPVPGFRLTSYLGGGEFSNVWKATAPGGAEAAIKIVNLMSNQTLKEFRSLRLLRRIRHPHIVPLMAFWLKDYQGRLLDDRQFDESISQKRRPAQLVIAMGLGDKSLADRLRECRAGGDAGIGPGDLLRF